jgi:hypothetical protein
VLYIYQISPSKVLILCLRFIFITSVFHGFWFSGCALYLSDQPFKGSDSLSALWVYSISTSRVLILCVCFISISSVLHGFWLSNCALYSPHQPFMGFDSLVVFYIYHISPSRVLILWLCFISIPSVLHGFWFSVCVLCLFHHLFTGSDSLFVLYIYSFSTSRVHHISPSWLLILCLCFIYIPSVLHGFWFSVCVLYLFHQLFMDSDSLFVFYIYFFSTSRVHHISPSKVLILCLCFISIPSVLHGFWFSVCVLCLFHQLFTGSDSLFVFYIHHISLLWVLTLLLCSISITSALQGFWFFVCVLYLCLQHFTGSDSLFVLYIRHISLLWVLTLCLCSTSITSALQWFWFSVCVLHLFHQYFTGSDSLFVLYVYSISSSRDLIICLCFISSVSGPHRPITPNVKPFFPPDPPQMTSLTPFHRVSRLCEFFVVLFARVSRFNNVLTLWFQFWSRVLCSFNFLMTICSFC